MYICNKCGNVLDDLPTEDYHHDPFDYRLTETFQCTDCHCGGEYQEAISCDICGRYYLEEQLRDGWCLHCIKENTTTETMLQYINQDSDIQKDFYIGVQFDHWICHHDAIPDGLLQFCKNRFDSLLELASLDPFFEIYVQITLWDFISYDTDHFHCWLTSHWKA